MHLNCWVEGDHPKLVFPVNIEGTESVGTLKEVIKEKMKEVQAFDHVPANALDLYKVRTTQMTCVIRLLIKVVA
jgi:hypothetical protein